MKIQAALFSLALLAACSSPSGNSDQATPGPTTTNNPQPTQPDTTAATASATGASATAIGTVQTVDTATGKITIAHGPVAALNWPAMTMAFNATPEQLASVQAGQKVQFEFVAQGMSATIRSISPVQ